MQDQRNISRILNDLVKEIQTGIARNSVYPPQKYDGGIQAIHTYIKSPPENIFSKLKKKSSIQYVLNCGGTHWEGVTVNIDSKGVKVLPEKTVISFTNPEERRCQNLDKFVEKVANLLYKTVQDKKTSIDSVAIVLGFAHGISFTEYGIDAEFRKNDLSKGWYISGNLKGNKIGRKLQKIMREKYNISIENTFFGNDAALMPWDVSVKLKRDEKLAPIGGVWGSGTNLGFVYESKKNNKKYIINTEIGHSRCTVTNRDKENYKYMKKIDPYLPQEPDLESFVGGDHLFTEFAGQITKIIEQTKIIGGKRLIHSLHSLAKEKNKSEIIHKIIQKPSKKNISHLLDVPEKSLNDKLVRTIKESASYTFDNAALKIALMISACIEVMNLSQKYKWVIPAEGSVLLKGKGIEKKVHEYFKKLLPEYSIRFAKDGSCKEAIALCSSFYSNFKK